MIRYPFAPLAQAMGVSEGAACKYLRISGSTEQEYRRDGISERVADRLATKAGFHPYSIWPEMAEQAIDDASRPCDECGERFIPSRKDGRFCTRACYRRGVGRDVVRRYWEDPERHRAVRRARYEANRERERALAKERYERTRDARLAYQREYKARKRAEARTVAA